MAALDELLVARQKAMADPVFIGEFETILRDYGGVPSPLYHAGGSASRRPDPASSTQDLNHTGAHKDPQRSGQAAADPRRMGKTVIAETGASQHGVASDPPRQRTSA